jgi:hypothetical protein
MQRIEQQPVFECRTSTIRPSFPSRSRLELVPMWHAAHKNSLLAGNAFLSSSRIFTILTVSIGCSRGTPDCSSFRSVRSIGFRVSRMPPRVFTRREEKVHPKRQLRRSFISRDSKPDRAYTFSPSVCFAVPHLPKHCGHYCGIYLPSKTGCSYRHSGETQVKQVRAMPSERQVANRA